MTGRVTTGARPASLQSITRVNITFPNFLDKKFTQIPCLHQCWSLASLASANLARVRPLRNKAGSQAVLRATWQGQNAEIWRLEYFFN